LLLEHCADLNARRWAQQWQVVHSIPGRNGAWRPAADDGMLEFEGLMLVG